MSKKSSKKESRERAVLLGLIELYLELGKPVGSNTLKESGFEEMSSATIRNYFVELEKQGYLKQPHSSGGRVPTNAAFRLYADLARSEAPVQGEDPFAGLGEEPTKNATLFLQTVAEKLAEVSNCAAFLSSVRFDHDFVLEIKLVSIDASRLLCVIVTDFGQILTEIISCEQKLSGFAIKRLESYFQWKLKGGKEASLDPQEQELATRIYNELMVRYLVRYSNFSDEDIFRTGFSHLLSYPEFNDPIALTTGLSLFENTAQMRQLLGDCARHGALRCWIGTDLAPYATMSDACAVVAIPYEIGGRPAGAIGLLGPTRMPYKEIFAYLHNCAETISKSLTSSLYKFKLTFREPRSYVPYIQQQERALIEGTQEKS